MKPKYNSNKLHASSESNTNTNVGREFMKILPIVSFAVGITGVCFQVFVLYPWHEELSYEFKALELEIIRLDKTLERLSPDGKEMVLDRITDKYTLKPDANTAGPRISKYLPVIPAEERRKLDAIN
jgi:hypothetical protein